MGSIIVTRPPRDAAPLIARLAAMGYDSLQASVIDIRFLADAAIPSIPFQAILFTSANGARALAHHPALKRLQGVVAVAVGEASAAAAREAGFGRVVVAGGDVDHLVETVKQRLRPSAGPLLYASGRQTTGDIVGELQEAGFTLARSVLYEAVAAEVLPQAVIGAIAGDEADGVLIYSPRSARIWCRLALAAGLADALARLPHYCLSENVKRALDDSGCGAVPVLVATRPEEAALLALLAKDKA